jgi:dTMP kinase
MQGKNIFISIEGVEGVGKSTAVQFIQKYLESKNIPLVTTREPGGTEIAEAIRQVLLKPHKEVMVPNAELLLMFAGRAQNTADIIRPALLQGQWVLSDRFVDASFAYQGGGRGIPKERILELEKWVVGDVVPKLTFLLDAPVELGLSRIVIRGVKDRIENEGLEFFKRVRQAYLDRAREFPERFHIIQAQQSLQEVQEQLQQGLEPYVNAYLNAG